MLHLNTKKRLQAKGILATKHRVSVLRAFIYFNKPITLSAIRSYVKEIDRVTLFRILSNFEEKKIIHKIILGDGKTMYALCADKCAKNTDHTHDHIHFVCNQCEDVTCLEIEKFPTINVPDFLINNLNINASGICETCNSNK